MLNGSPNFSIDYGRLKEISERAHRAYVEGRGIFRHKETFLPQWALPQNFEYDPRRTETRCPIQAGDYLFLLASLERRSLSKQNIKNGLKAWENEDTRWVFNPEEVVKKTPDEIREVIVEGFQYNIDGFPDNFLYNSRVLVRKFGGHARNIINNQTVEESRRRLVEFKGIASGIANLFIIYCTDRMVAHVKDPENIKLKIDIHKARIPANTDAVTLVNGRIRRDVLVPSLEEAYLEICKEQGFNGGTLDSTLWLIGSQICAKRDFGECVNLCPLETMCTSCVREDSSTAELVLYDQNKRVETRRDGTVQLYLGLDL